MQTNQSDIVVNQTTDSKIVSNSSQQANLEQDKNTEKQDREHLVKTINALCDCV